MRLNFRAVQSEIGEYWTSDASVSHLRDTMMGKRAVDNPGTDDFERSFSSLAHQYIKSKAPQLLDYAIGFQTIKRVDNPSKAKAVGVFGFKVDDLWLFVPVFFLQGDLKGHELLWVKNRDAFLPCKENWVTFLINRQPTELGEPSEADYIGLGGKKPNFRRLFQPQFFGNKFASWTEHCLPLFAAADQGKVYRKTASWTGPFDLAQEAASDPVFLVRLHQAAQAYPLIKQGIDQFYGPDMLQKAAARHRKAATDGLLGEDIKPNTFADLRKFASILGEPRVNTHVDLSDLFAKEASAPPQSKLKILRTAESIFDMDVASKAKYAQDGFLAIDERPDDAVHKVAVDESEAVTTLITPSKSGMYELPQLSGDFKKMIVIQNYLGPAGSKRLGLLVIDPDSKDEYARFPSNNVLAKPDNYVGTIMEDNRDAGAQLKSWAQANSTKEISENGVYIAIDQNMNSTMPFIVNKKTDNDRFLAEFMTHQTARLEVDNKFHPAWPDNRIDVTMGQPGSGITSGRQWMAIPANAFLIKLEQREDKTRWEDTKAPPISNTERVLGEIQRKYASYSVFFDGESFESKIHGKASTFDRDREVVIDLMVRGGLREKQAKDIVGIARNRGSNNVKVKLAYSVDIPDQWTGTESVGPRSIQANYAQKEMLPVDGMSHEDPTAAYSQSQYFSPDTGMMQTAQQAAASGQKDLFDIGALAALANTADTETMIDRYIGRYMSAIDGLGRTLFHIYNNYESLSDRYGSSDMPQLEDGVRNTFVALGDTTLYLKEKSVGGNNNLDLTGRSPDISGLSS